MAISWPIFLTLLTSLFMVTFAVSLIPCRGQNEERVPCIEAVCRQKYCAEKGRPITCKENLPKDQCHAGCICKKGFLRNFRDVCVPETAKGCTALQCTAPNEKYSVSLKPKCPILDTCISIIAFIICDEPEVPGCTCEDGFLRANVTSPCTPSCQCFEIKNSEECKKKG